MQTPNRRAGEQASVYNKLVIGWMLAAMIGMLSAPTALINDAAQLALLPMAALALILLLDKSFSLNSLFRGPDRSNRIMGLVIAGLWFLMLSMTNLLNAPLFSEGGLGAIWWKNRWERLLYLAWNWIGFLSGYVFSVYACGYYVFYRALGQRSFKIETAMDIRQAQTPKKLRWIGLYPAVIPLLLAAAACVFASKPSLFIGDAPSVWYGVRDSLWSEWHTAGYMLFVKLCTLIWNSQRMVTLVQLIACVFIHNYALTCMAEAGCTRRAQQMYIAAAIISFVPLYFLQVIIKDVVFSLSLFAFTLGIVRIVSAQKPRIRHWVWLGAFGLCTCLFRHAGILPVGCGLLGIAIFFLSKKSKAVWGAVLSGACIVVANLLIVNLLAYRVMNFERNPAYIAMSAPMTMIGAVAASGEPIDPDDLAIMEQIMPREKWAACYKPYFADSISRPYGAIGSDVEKISQQNLSGALIRLNARFLFAHTKTYLKAFFDLNSLAWEIATPSDGYVRSYLGYPVTPISDFVMQQGFGDDGIEDITKELKQAEDTTFTGLAPIVNRYAELLYGWPVTRCLFWRGGLANLAMVFAGLVLIKKRRSRVLLAFLPIAGVTLGMLFSMPAQEVRYVFASLLCAPFFVAYALCAKPHAKGGEPQ